MAMGLMRGIGVFYYWTWFIWPFLFMFSFANGLSLIIKDEEGSIKSILIASTSLLIILAGINAPNFGL